MQKFLMNALESLAGCSCDLAAASLMQNYAVNRIGHAEKFYNPLRILIALFSLMCNTMIYFPGIRYFSLNYEHSPFCHSTGNIHRIRSLNIHHETAFWIKVVPRRPMLLLKSEQKNVNVYSISEVPVISPLQNH